MSMDVEMELSEVELDLFTTLACVILSLCPLSTPTTLPKPDQLQGDLVGAEEVPAPEGKEAEKEKAVTSTSSESTLHASLVPSSFGRSRSATPACSCEASPSPAKPQVTTKGATSMDAFHGISQTAS